MPELIDANVLKSELCSVCDMHDACVTVCETIRIINKQHTIKAKPMRHGRWETCEDYDGDVIYRCSACGEEWTLIAGTPKENNMYYCPNCGARMDGGADNA